MPIILVLFIVFSVGDVSGQNISASSFSYNGNIYHTGGNIGIGTNSPETRLELKKIDSVCFRLKTTNDFYSANPCKGWEDYIWDIKNQGDLRFNNYYTYCGVTMPYKTLMTLTPEGQLSIGTTSPDASTIMQINSTDRGLLIPRMTTPEKNAISTPANGLLVFDTDLQAFSYYDTNAGVWLNIAETTALNDYLLISDFNNHPASTISTDNINNWNTAYAWGNHADAGYLTSFTETDPVYTAWDKDYNDLTNKPDLFDGQWGSLKGTVPNISIFPNDAGYITEAGGTFLWGRENENTFLLNPFDNVGIGTNNPMQSLHIYKENDLSGEYEDASLRLHNYYYGGIISAYPHQLWDLTAVGNLLKLNFGGGEEGNPNPETDTKFTFKFNAMMGIGTDNPEKQLHITNKTAPTIRLERKDEDGGIGFMPTSWDIRSDGTNLNFDFTGGNNYNPSKFVLASNGTFTATKFVGDGSGLTNIAGAWLTNGDNIYYDAGNVGIGTANPSSKLEVSNNGNSFIYLRNTDNTNGSILKIGAVSTNGYKETQMQFEGKFGLYDHSVQTWRMRILENGNVGIGIANPNARLQINNGAIKITGGGSLGQGSRFQIDTEGSYAHKFLEFRNANGEQFGVWGNGTVKCKEVIIELDEWKDNVFNKDYNLKSIEEIEEYITGHGHLPNIPSEKEMIKNGLETSEMIKLQMQKIEELTLYIIEQNKRIKKLEKTIGSGQ